MPKCLFCHDRRFLFVITKEATADEPITQSRSFSCPLCNTDKDITKWVVLRGDEPAEEVRATASKVQRAYDAVVAAVRTA